MTRLPHLWTLLPAALIVFAFVPLTHSQAAQPKTCLTNCTSAELSTDDGGDVRELMQTLGTAYRNSVMHDAANADLEAGDRRLENSSIGFSLRMLDKIGEGICQSADPATASVVDRPCALDDELAGLNELNDSLSYAAFRLEKISSLSTTDVTNPKQEVLARIRSMEHLYRMVFALSHLYLDWTQSAVYLQAAGEQLRLARSSMEYERELCGCDAAGSVVRFQGLAQLSNRITSLRGASLP